MTLRQKTAAELLREHDETPGRLGICLACGSIIRLTASCCPVCNAYRFEETPGLVREQIKRLAEQAATSVEPKDLQ